MAAADQCQHEGHHSTEERQQRPGDHEPAHLWFVSDQTPILLPSHLHEVEKKTSCESCSMVRYAKNDQLPGSKNTYLLHYGAH